MIQYSYKNTLSITVKLNKKKIGEIKAVKGGYQYYPLNHKIGGEIYPTIELVKKSLETEY